MTAQVRPLSPVPIGQVGEEGGAHEHAGHHQGLRQLHQGRPAAHQVPLGGVDKRNDG